MSDENTTRRLEALESQAAFQEQAIEQLNETITKQWTLIDRLMRQVDALTERLREAEDKAGQGPASEPPPPHY